MNSKTITTLICKKCLNLIAYKSDPHQSVEFFYTCDCMPKNLEQTSENGDKQYDT